ncbi:MAG TPA: response regulator transcription factor [Candidatus Dormibacteraeota bacterium]
MSTSLRVMVVDDYELVRGGLRSVLEAAGFDVVAEADSARSAVETALRTRPDVVIMDVRLGSGSGVEATREIRNQAPSIKVLMLTAHSDDEAVLASVMAGAAGYFQKRIAAGDLVRAVRKIAEGADFTQNEAAQMAIARLRRGKHLSQDDRLARLSPQEEKILELVADGLTNGQIGHELQTAEKTVKNYMSSILAKLEVGRRAEAAAYLACRSAQSKPTTHP